VRRELISAAEAEIKFNYKLIKNKVIIYTPAQALDSMPHD
jgi:hypothetical protein